MQIKDGKLNLTSTIKMHQYLSILMLLQPKMYHLRQLLLTLTYYFVIYFTFILV